MARTDVAAASNARMVTRVEYGIDPRGWSWVHGLNARLHGGISGRGARQVLPGNARFNGVAQTPQRFTGVATLGSASPRVDRTATLGDVRDAAAANPALQVFAERTRRRQR